MKVYTTAATKVLLFWAQFGAENAWDGQYRHALDKLIPNLEWGKNLPKLREMYLAEKEIQELTKKLNDSKEEAADYLRKYKNALTTNRSLRDAMGGARHDPLTELIDKRL